MLYLKWAFIAFVTATAGACMRDSGDFAVPLGHPADAGARSGAVLISPAALEPELQTVKPQVGASPAPSPAQAAPASGGHQHKH